MKRTLLFIACVLASLDMPAQESSYFDYVPFVKEGKKWNVVRSDFDAGYHFDCYMLTGEEVVKEEKTYMKMYRSKDDMTVVNDAVLLREENRKVFIFDTEMQKEQFVFDYSLKAGDTYETYSYDEQKMLTYKVLSVSDFAEGPTLYRESYCAETDNTTTQQRYLRKWVVCSTDNNYHKIWIEGVGSLEGPLANLYDVRPISSRDYLTYVEYGEFDYLPFSFHDIFKQIHGCKLPTSEANNSSDRHHHLTYELEGDCLHVYGEVFTQCGPNNYAYFIENTTDDPMVHIIEFEIQEVEPLADCMALHSTDFYVPGFDPNLNYIVVDNHREEHPVINKTPQKPYRPFIEDGKVWAVEVYPDGYGLSRDDKWTEYYYFDGDTIIGGQTCKRMMCVTNDNEEELTNGIFTPGNRPRQYIGAWYEQDKKVYYAFRGQQQAELLYDFTLSSGESIASPDGTMLTVTKLSEGITGFKGTYYDIAGVERWLEGVGSESWPYRNHPMWFTGYTGILLSCRIGDEVIYCNSEEEDPYVMGAPKQRFDFTHTIKTRPKRPMNRGAELSLYGEYNEQQLGIHLAPLNDDYQVRITSETGKVVYEKAVNAGNIVALNIDISDYAKGRYDVMVENTREYFTGEFETQTAGIKDVWHKKSAERTIIYNLQGQQITSLQKGLNIVNGQKVYIK